MKEQLLKKCNMGNPYFKDMVFGIATLVFFGAVLLLTPKYGGQANAQALTSGATSKTYPYIIGAGGVFVSLWLIIDKGIKLFRECRRETPKEIEAAADVPAEGEKIRWKMVILCVAAMALMNVLLIKLGVVLGGILYLLVQILILTEKKDLTKKNIIIAVIVSVCVPLLIYFPFKYIFHTKLPMGVFR